MEQGQRYHGGSEDNDFDDQDAAPVGQERREKLAESTDALLDDIDDILEENAETFMNAFIQKGGQ